MEAARTDRKMTPLMLLQEAFLFIIQHPEYTTLNATLCRNQSISEKLSQSPERLA
jgi:hypothetical protein